MNKELFSFQKLESSFQFSSILDLFEVFLHYMIDLNITFGWVDILCFNILAFFVFNNQACFIITRLHIHVCM